MIILHDISSFTCIDMESYGAIPLIVTRRARQQRDPPAVFCSWRRPAVAFTHPLQAFLQFLEETQWFLKLLARCHMPGRPPGTTVTVFRSSSAAGMRRSFSSSGYGGCTRVSAMGSPDLLGKGGPAFGAGGGVSPQPQAGHPSTPAGEAGFTSCKCRLKSCVYPCTSSPSLGAVSPQGSC